MRIITLDQIMAVLSGIDLMQEIESGFAAYSDGRAVVPPVGELILQEPPGEVHIKYGYITGDEYYVVKIASGFCENSKLGLPAGNGLMLLFEQESGVPRAVLLDEGLLTNIRTAVAGAVAAKYLAPSSVSSIGIFGTGCQARLQLQYLQPVTDCRDVVVWGRDQEKLDIYARDMSEAGYTVKTTMNQKDVLRNCNLIVTTTPTTVPLLSWFDDIEHGVHITAVGSDTAHKQELDFAIMCRADRVVADSISQCLLRGEIYQALKNDAIQQSEIVELGDLINGVVPGRASDDQVTIADLTGVAVQDIQIARAVFNSILNDA